MIDESIISFPGNQAELLGVLARPLGDTSRRTAVVIVVGGPQTRVGSHRQFVALARRLAAEGFPCLRFDYTGMGDSAGPKPDFEDAGDDIRCACDAVLAAVPGYEKVALWGLCDGATAAVFHARNDERVSAVIAANPWARSDATRSAALVQSHYGSRLRSPEFWKKLASGGVDVTGAVREAIGHLRGARRADSSSEMDNRSLPLRLAEAVQEIRGKVHFQLSGKDLTATEFELAMKRAGLFAVGDASTLRLPDADHTFSEPAAWAAAVEDAVAFLQRRDE